MYIKVVHFVNVDRIHLAQDRDRCLLYFKGGLRPWVLCLLLETFKATFPHV